jgi:hypothetical protein
MDCMDSRPANLLLGCQGSSQQSVARRKIRPQKLAWHPQESQCSRVSIGINFRSCLTSVNKYIYYVYIYYILLYIYYIYIKIIINNLTRLAPRLNASMNSFCDLQLQLPIQKAW